MLVSCDRAPAAVVVVQSMSVRSATSPALLCSTAVSGSEHRFVVPHPLNIGNGSVSLAAVSLVDVFRLSVHDSGAILDPRLGSIV